MFGRTIVSLLLLAGTMSRLSGAAAFQFEHLNIISRREALQAAGVSLAGIAVPASAMLPLCESDAQTGCRRPYKVVATSFAEPLT